MINYVGQVIKGPFDGPKNQAGISSGSYGLQMQSKEETLQLLLAIHFLTG